MTIRMRIKKLNKDSQDEMRYRWSTVGCFEHYTINKAKICNQIKCKTGFTAQTQALTATPPETEHSKTKCKYNKY